MRTHFKLLFFIVNIFLISSSINYATNKIVIYPTYTTEITQNFVRTVNNNVITIKKLPFGVLTDTIQIVKPLNIHSYSYSFDLDNQEKLFNKLSGKLFTIQKDKVSTTYEFLYKDQDNMYFRKGSKIYLNPEGNIAFPTKGIAPSPYLSIQLPKSKATKKSVDLSYRLDSINTSIRYKAIFDEKAKKITIAPFLHIFNNSGYDFNNYQIEVVSGKPYFVNNGKPKYYSGNERFKNFASVADSTEILAKRLDEFYKFPLKGKYNIKKGKLTAIPLFKSQTIDAKKIIRYEAPRLYTKVQTISKAERMNTIIQFNNKTQSPLPAGTISVFSNGSLIGEHSIKAMSLNESQEIKYGKAFDLIAQKTCLGTENIPKDRAIITEFSIKVSSFKKRIYLKNVEVIETLPGPDWTVVKSSHPYQHISASKIKVLINIAPGTSQTIHYTLHRKNIK